MNINDGATSRIIHNSCVIHIIKFKHLQIEFKPIFNTFLIKFSKLSRKINGKKGEVKEQIQLRFFSFGINSRTQIRWQFLHHELL